MCDGLQAAQTAGGSDWELRRGGKLLAEEKQKLPQNEENPDPVNVNFTVKEFKYAVHSVPSRSSLC